MIRKHHLPGLLLAVLMAVNLPAQHNVLLMEAELENSRSDTARTISLLTKLTDAYDIVNVPKVVEYGQELWALGQKKGDAKAMAFAAYALSGAYHFDLRESNKAIDWAMRANEIVKQSGDSMRIADTYCRMAAINADNGDMRRASQYFKEAYKLGEQIKYYHMMVMASVFLGDYAKPVNQKKFYYNQALRAVAKMPQDTARQVQVMVTMGDFYWDQKDTILAQKEYQKAFDLTYNNAKLRNDPEYTNILAHTCLRLGKYNEAIEVANALARMSAASNDWLHEKSLQYLSQAQHLIGNDSLAFVLLGQYVVLHDSTNHKRFDEQVQSHFANMQTEMEIKNNARQLELLHTKGRYETTIAYVLASTVLLLSGIIYYLWRLRQREAVQNQKLGQINQTKDKLLSIISHDVRSPVQAIQNIVDLFAQDIATKEDVQTVAKQVGASINNLAAGLDNLFYWAQSQQNELLAYPESFDISELVHAQLDQFAVLYKRKNIAVDNQLAGKTFIRADVLHVRLIFNNIFGNAIKFTNEGGAITLTFNRLDEGYCVLSVHNTGTPIREEDLPLILDAGVRYTRLGTKGEPGSGLGLALSHDLMKLNNGKLVLRRDGDIGTIVELVFVVGSPENSPSST